MRPSALEVLLLLVLASASWGGLHGATDSKQDGKENKFRQREASDDLLGYPNIDEDSLLNSKCPRHVELRWQTEVSSSVYATPLVADINSDGKLEVVVPSFVHYLEVLEGSDGDKLAGWPSFHQSTVHSSPLLYDIDKDGTREIALATYNGVINFFRPTGYMMTDKLEVPRRKVRKNWYVGLHPDPVDRSHPDIHDPSLSQESAAMNSSTMGVNASLSSEILSTHGVNVSKIEPEGKLSSPKSEGSIEDSAKLHNETVRVESVGGINGTNSTHSQRKLLEESHPKGPQDEGPKLETNIDGSVGKASTVENNESLEEDADASFDLLRGGEELADEYNYDYDDYVDESMWGDEGWAEGIHQKMEDYVDVDAHILCTPVIADIDNDGISEMIVAVSYFFDREYYDNPDHLAELGGISIDKYVAGSIVAFNLDTRQVKWTRELDLSIDNGTFRAYMYSSPTVVDLDGDGNLDIIVGSSFGLCYVLDHRGNVREKFPLEMAEIQAPVVAADINDDGKIEIVTADVHGNVAAWTAQGKEIWEVHLKSLIPQGPTIGDVDGDGRTDIVVPTISGNIYVLSGKDGSLVRPFPYRTNGRVMNQVLLLDLNKPKEKQKSLTLVTTSFDGYLYLIDGKTACADVVDIGETSYSMVLADNVDGGDDLDLIVTTMNGNVFCFSTPLPHHPLKGWRASSQGRNNVANRHNREGIYISPSLLGFLPCSLKLPNQPQQNQMWLWLSSICVSVVSFSWFASLSAPVPLSRRRPSTPSARSVLRFTMQGGRMVVEDSVRLASILTPSKLNFFPSLTKIVATLGPKSRSVEVIESCLTSGMSVARFDFSWLDSEYHQETLENLRKAVKNVKKLCAVMLDTVGPEVQVCNTNGSPIELKIDDRVTITPDISKVPSSGILPVNYAELAKAVKKGDTIFVGQYLFTGSETTSVWLEVIETNGEDVICLVKNSATLSGFIFTMHVAQVNINLPTLTETDKQVISTWGSRNSVDIISLSYTRHAGDVQQLRAFLDAHNLSETQIFAKIENVEGLMHFDDILQEADGIILSRGNLGIDLPPEKVFLFQKAALHKCNMMGKSAIVTRVVDSMTDNLRPTRAEATDVANAVLDGADGILLGAETLRGLYPVDAIKTVGRICAEAETVYDQSAHFKSVVKHVGEPMSHLESVASSAVRAAIKVKAAIIVVLTMSGRAGRLIAKYRPPMPVLAVVVPRLRSNSLKWSFSGALQARQSLAVRGVYPVLASPNVVSSGSPGDGSGLALALGYAKSVGLVKTHDRVVVFQKIGDSSVVEIVELQDA